MRRSACVCQIRTTSTARRAAKLMRTCDSGGKTRTALEPCSMRAERMLFMNSSIASKSSRSPLLQKGQNR
jgi:hypothetical protein